MVYFIVISCSIYTCNCFEGHRVISVLGLLLIVLLPLNKAYYYYYYYSFANWLSQLTHLHIQFK